MEPEHDLADGMSVVWCSQLPSGLDASQAHMEVPVQHQVPCQLPVADGVSSPAQSMVPGTVPQLSAGAV